MTNRTESSTQRIHIALDADELAAIDDYSFRARIRTRSAAIRDLIRAGLKASELDQESDSSEK
ncbi:hypothetical protein [Pelagivirga sediminicola]|uniref:hypothetical protein n=1 Tax=Pelagivirga sediminicola TaxID=2170575 RepID=UPI0010573813|nr:hypothetical protein [Pelagivirga sediminicola]